MDPGSASLRAYTLRRIEDEMIWPITGESYVHETGKSIKALSWPCPGRMADDKSLLHSKSHIMSFENERLLASIMLCLPVLP
jgi:hypothetical protein